MLPSPRDYENLHRRLLRPERNLNAQSYFSPILTSASNMSSSSTDTSGSYESSPSFPSAEKQEFRQYQLFKSSCDTPTNHPNDWSFIESTNYSELSRQISETQFSRSSRPPPKRRILPETNSKNKQFDLINVLYPSNEIEICLPQSSTMPVTSLNSFSDFNFSPSPSPYTENTSENNWELNSNALFPIMINDSHHSAEFLLHHLNNQNSIDFEALESSSGRFSETSIYKTNSTSPGSFGYLPPVSPLRTFEKLKNTAGFSDSLSESSVTMSTVNKYISSPIRNTANYERKHYTSGSSSGIFCDSTISPSSEINNPGFMEYKSPHKHSRNFERLNQGSSSGLYSENSFYTVTKNRPGLNDYKVQASPIKNSIGFETPNQGARLAGRFSEPQISSITSISPGSIGYMPRVTPITNPINFEKLNEDAKSSSGIKTDQICTFCKKNGERQKVYSTHSVKVKVGNKYVVTCPVLRSHVCSICGGTGDNAHTLTYCPLVSDANKKRPPSTTVTLKSTRMKSNGKKRYNYDK